MSGSTPIARVTTPASSETVYGLSAPTLNTWLQASGRAMLAAITGAAS